MMVSHQNIHISARGPLHPYIYSLSRRVLGEISSEPQEGGLAQQVLTEHRCKDLARLEKVCVMNRGGGGRHWVQGPSKNGLIQQERGQCARMRLPSVGRHCLMGESGVCGRAILGKGAGQN
jgi:hypothetical protein